jgi:hypothetical protein
LSARLRREAIFGFGAALDAAIGCVAITKVPARREPGSDHDLLAFETPGEAVQLRSRLGLGLRVRLRARVGPVEDDPGRWQVQIVAYQYALLDREAREYLAYHWHPEGSSHVTEPHLHLGPAAEVGVPVLAAAHLPTGPVSLTALVRLAIHGLDARSLRTDWPVILDQAAALLTPD